MSVIWSKLCQSKVLPLSVVKTKFPESSSWHEVLFLLVGETGIETLLNHMTVVVFREVSVRRPSPLIERIPRGSVMGLSLLATQTTVCTETLVNQIPTYFRAEFPGLKNPRVNFPALDVKTSPSLRGLVGVMVSVEAHNCSERNRNRALRSISLNNINGVYSVEVI